MAATLRDVLHAFETAKRPCTLNQMARDLEITPGLLDGMIQHWVRKGKLRPIHTGTACEACGGASQCPFIAALPPTYELATGDTSAPDGPVCACCE